MDSNDKSKQSVNIQTNMLIVDERYKTQIQNFLLLNYSIEMIEDLATALNGQDILKIHWGIIGIRMLLSISQNPPIQLVIDLGLVHRMIQFIEQTEYPQLQLESTWALTNVASGTSSQCQTIIQNGGIPLFVDLLKSNKKEIVEQAIWAISNISSDNVFNRDSIIRQGGITNLVSIVEPLNDDKLIKFGCWTLSNLCRGNPLPQYIIIKDAISVICKAIACGRLKDKQILIDCCWALAFHSDDRNNIQIPIDSEVIPRIIENLLEPDQIGQLLIPSLRIIGNITSGTTDQTNYLLPLDILTVFQHYLCNQKKTVRRYCCWGLSNIAAGNKTEVDALLSRPNLLKIMLNMIKVDNNEVKKQICYFFSNMTHSDEAIHIIKLFKSFNIIGLYLDLLAQEEQIVLQAALIGIQRILQYGQMFKEGGQNLFVWEVYQSESANLLLNLQNNIYETIKDIVDRILMTYF